MSHSLVDFGTGLTVWLLMAHKFRLLARARPIYHFADFIIMPKDKLQFLEKSLQKCVYTSIMSIYILYFVHITSQMFGHKWVSVLLTRDAMNG